MKGAPLVVALFTLGACTRGGGDLPGPARELLRISRAADRLTYDVSYQYTLVPAPSPGVDTTFQVVQRPPDRLRRLETSQRSSSGPPLRVGRWSIERKGMFYSCSSFGDDVTCIPWIESKQAFGYAQLDEVHELVRKPRALTSVEEAKGATIAGTRASCFEATPRPHTPPPVTSPQPRFTPTRFVFEICYSSDGILLRARRTVAGPVPAGAPRLESLLEATSVSRTVSRSDFELPGPVRSPGAPVPSASVRGVRYTEPGRPTTGRLT